MPAQVLPFRISQAHYADPDEHAARIRRLSWTVKETWAFVVACGLGGVAFMWFAQ